MRHTTSNVLPSVALAHKSWTSDQAGKVKLCKHQT